MRFARGPSAWRWLAGGLGLTLIIWAIDLASGPMFADDLWFVQVIHRLSSGDQLYSEVFYGVPPLAAWISLPLVAAFGSELAVIKFVGDAIIAATALVAVKVSRQVGIGAYGQILVGLATAGFVFMPTFSPYGPLAYLMLIATLSAALSWQRNVESGEEGRHREHLSLIAAGAFAGLSITSKQSVGLLALAALLGVVVLFRPAEKFEPRRRLADAALVTGVAGAVTAVVLSPVIISGSLGDFSSMVLQKGDYARSGSISYLDGFGHLRDAIADPGHVPRLIPLNLSFVIMPMAVVALAFAARQRPGIAGPLMLFLLASIAGAFPRADAYHVVQALPLAAIAIAWSLQQLGSRLPALGSPFAMAGLAVLVAVTAGVSLLDVPLRSLSRGYSASDLSPFRGVLLSRADQDALAGMANRLAAADQGQGRTFLLVPDAAMLYLAAGVPNPTRYDYPTNSAIRGADRTLISEIEAGRIDRVCLGPYLLAFEPLAPERLIEYVEQQMVPVGDIGPAPFLVPSCTLYTRMGAVGAAPPT
jgi:hypothetical protein